MILKANNYIKITLNSKRNIYLYLANCVIISLYMAKNNLKGRVEVTKVEQIQNRIDELTTAINAGDSDVQLTLWEMERTEKRKELALEEAQQQDAEVQQQAQTAQIDGLKEIIRSIRDAVYLKELMDIKLGLTENATNIQDFNSMVDQAVDEDQLALRAWFNTQLDQRDEKFRALTSQALDVQNQLDKVNITIQSHVETIVNHEKTLSDLRNDAVLDADSLNQKDAEISRLEKLLKEEKSHTFDLQKALNDAPAPKPAIDITPTAPSESLSERIAQAKVNSKLQLANVKSIGGNWVEGVNEEGNKEVAHITQVEHVTEFPSLPAIEIPAEQVPTFPEDHQVSSEASETDTSGDRNEVVHESVAKAAEETTVTRAEFQAALDRIERIEIQANIKAVA